MLRFRKKEEKCFFRKKYEKNIYQGQQNVNNRRINILKTKKSSKKRGQENKNNNKRTLGNNKNTKDGKTYKTKKNTRRKTKQKSKPFINIATLKSQTIRTTDRSHKKKLKSKMK